MNFSIVTDFCEINPLSNFGGDTSKIDKGNILTSGEDEFAITIMI